MSRTRAFIFVWNNYTEDNVEYLKTIPCHYIIFGKEVGKQGTPHLQGYIYFTNPRSFEAVCKLLKGCHVERAKGNADQNYKYSTKDGDFYEHGTKPLSQEEKGDCERERWDNARQAALTGNFDDIPSDLYIRYRSTFKRIRLEDHPDPAPLETRIHYGVWIWGIAGTGKSHYARDKYSPLYVKGANKWWDNYVEGHNVLIEELEIVHGIEMSSYIKRWADKWPFNAESKGGSMTIRPPLIVITSNHPIEAIFHGVDRDAIKRRFEVIHLTEVYKI